MNSTRNVRRLDKTMTEVIWWTHALISLPLIYFTAGLVPGDTVNLNVIGSVFMITTFVVLDLMITGPCYLWRRKINRPVLSPVRRNVR